MTQHVLVHIDQVLGPIGVWGYYNNQLTHFYPASLHPGIPARAREAMAARREHTVPEWFTLLADCDPTMLDDYQTSETSDGVSLPAVLAEARRDWKTSD